jgi:hypothetical protein
VYSKCSECGKATAARLDITPTGGARASLPTGTVMASMVDSFSSAIANKLPAMNTVANATSTNKSLNISVLPSIKGVIIFAAL